MTEIIFSRPIDVTRASVARLQALGTTRTAVGRIAVVRNTLTVWKCQSVDASSSVWVPVAGEWHCGAFAETVTESIIQLVIDSCAAAGGGRVYIPAGTFTITAPIVLPEKVELVGAGRRATILQGGAIGEAFIEGEFTAYHVSNRNVYGGVSELTIDNTTPAAGSTGVDASQWSHFIMRDVEIRNCETGVKLEGVAYYNRIEKIRVTGCTTGVTVKNGARRNDIVGGRLSGCTTALDVAGGVDSGVNDLVVGEVAFEANTTAIAMDGSTNTVTGVVCNPCRFENNTTVWNIGEGVDHVNGIVAFGSGNTNLSAGAGAMELDFASNGPLGTRTRGQTRKLDRITTTDDALTQGAKLIGTLAGEAGFFESYTVGTCIDDPDKLVGYRVRGFAYRNSSGNLAVSDVESGLMQEGGALGTAVYRTTGNNLFIDVTGEAAITYQWAVFSTWGKYDL